MKVLGNLDQMPAFLPRGHLNTSSRRIGIRRYRQFDTVCSDVTQGREDTAKVIGGFHLYERVSTNHGGCHFRNDGFLSRVKGEPVAIGSPANLLRRCASQRELCLYVVAESGCG